VIIGGFQPCSLCDYPGKVSSVIFTQGCNFRCPFCHNAGLLSMGRTEGSLDAGEIVDRLRQGRKRVDSVVVTGGEPTVHGDLPAFLERLHGIGLSVKLDTNGGNTAMLRRLFKEGMLDYVAMDVKAPFAKYSLLAGANVSIDCVKTSIDLIAQSGVAHEFRTTVVPGLLDEEDIATIQNQLPPGSTYRTQPYRAVE